MCVPYFCLCEEGGGGGRRRGRGRRQREQVGGQQQWFEFTGVVGLWLGLKRRSETNWAALSWAKSQGSSATVPTLLSSHHQGEPLHRLIHYTSTHFCVAALIGDVLMEGRRPNVHNPLQSFAGMTATRQHSHWCYDAKNSIPLVWWCHEHLCRRFQSWFTGSLVQV